MDRPLQPVQHGRPEGVVVHRLADVIVHDGLQATVAIIVEGVGCHGHDRDGRPAGQPFLVSAPTSDTSQPRSPALDPPACRESRYRLSPYIASALPYEHATRSPSPYAIGTHLQSTAGDAPGGSAKPVHAALVRRATLTTAELGAQFNGARRRLVQRCRSRSLRPVSVTSQIRLMIQPHRASSQVSICTGAPPQPCVAPTQALCTGVQCRS